MRRWQLIELEDQTWFPASVRDGGTDYLKFVIEQTKPYRSIVPKLAAAIRRTGASRVVDLCSGAGGPWRILQPMLSAELGYPLELYLTDRYPNLPAWQQLQTQIRAKVNYSKQPVDARQVPAGIPGFRTLFSGFHHFEPRDAARILADAVQQRQGIAIFEATERRIPTLLGMLVVPLFILLVTPAIQPFRWSRLFFTYLLPAIPLMGLFDGVVSSLRSYTPQEMEDLTRPMRAFSWEVGQIKTSGFPVPITYTIGYPTQPPVS